jgi:hypothetical protein
MALKSSLIALLFAGVVFGQSGPLPPGPINADQQDPEDRNHGVARISLMNGDISVRRGDSGDFVAGNLNAPLLSGDSVQSGPASRAEIEFDVANRVRLGAVSEVRMGDLRAGIIQVQVARGTVSFTQISDSQAQIEISTPLASFKPLGRGAYRISILEDGTTELTVRAGGADIYTQAGTQRLQAGQTMMMRGNPNDPEFQIVAAVNRDEWDQFNETRDRELASSTAYRHVSRDVAGAQDLDQYGRWTSDPTYGDVWVPNVTPDWAPYQSGRWTWEDYYGWTWVSYDPWGWAPYHYGRWFRGPYGWGWVPGSIYARAFYRPALVGFFGFGAGAGFGFGFGFGNLGWVALAPFEAFHPWYGRGFYGAGVSHVNVVNNVNIYNTYRNAAMSMSSQQFAAGQFGHYTHPGAVQMQNAGSVRGQLPLAPSNSHLAFNNRATAVTTARSASASQHFVSRGGFSTAQRQSFTQQRQTLQQSFSTPRGVQEMGGGRSGASSGRGIITPGAGSGGSAGWERFGSPSNGSGRSYAPSSSQSGSGPSSGWSRFGSAVQMNPGGQNRSYGGGPSSNGGSTRSVQVAPSIVQQRPSNGSASAPPARSSAAPAQSGRSSGSGNSGRSSSSSKSRGSSSGHGGR